MKSPTDCQQHCLNKEVQVWCFAAIKQYGKTTEASQLWQRKHLTEMRYGFVCVSTISCVLLNKPNWSTGGKPALLGSQVPCSPAIQTILGRTPWHFQVAQHSGQSEVALQHFTETLGVLVFGLSHSKSKHCQASIFIYKCKTLLFSVQLLGRNITKVAMQLCHNYALTSSSVLVISHPGFAARCVSAAILL